MESQASIHLLPNEVLHEVFLCLSVPERLNASLVCKQWLDALNNKYLLRDIIVCINKKYLISPFLPKTRKFLNFKFEYMFINESYYKLFQSFSSHIEHLCFHRCERKKREPITFSDLTFGKLKELIIFDCDLWTILPDIPNLKMFYLFGDFADDDFFTLQKTYKHLESFSFICSDFQKNAMYKKYMYGAYKYEKNPTDRLSFTAFYGFVSENACTLNELELYPTLTPPALKDISCMKDLHLYKINLSHCILCADGLIDLFQNQPTLKTIILNGAFGINDEIINALCSLLPDVEEVSIYGNKITGQSLDKLFQLMKLHTLDIGGGQLLPCRVFNEAFSNFKAVELRSLKLQEKLINVENIAFDEFLRCCENLTYLDISFNIIPDSVIHAISENLTQLECLILQHCDISNYGLAGTHSSLSNLRKLRKLDLSDCTKITDDALINAIKFNHLQHLSLQGCHFSSSTIHRLHQQNPSIKKIQWWGLDDHDSYSKFIRNKIINTDISL